MYFVYTLKTEEKETKHKLRQGYLHDVPESFTDEWGRMNVSH